ncbi:hypothetical protein [Aeromonas sp. ASNIH4]|uniref:hypothetical protein n=2 Tax=Aeromonadaceae TaxID=84642 RepID=UPI0015E180FF|nr:hypothetical protein [Aeromonas sp. ASNIH4]
MMNSILTTPIEDLFITDIRLSTDKDFLIPLIFTSYRIAVRGQFGLYYLGHAGVLLVNGTTGQTRYYEYGRYPDPKAFEPGIVRGSIKQPVELDSGMIVESSFKSTLHEISQSHGQSSNIAGVVMRGYFYEKALDWINKKRRENHSPTKEAYGLFQNNCMTFVIDLAEHLGLDTYWRPPIVVPTLYAEQFQLQYTDLDYDFKNDILEVSE